MAKKRVRVRDDRIRTFVAEYERNGHRMTEAYMTAYPTANITTARVESSRLLQRAEVQKLMDEVRKKAMDKLEVSAERVVKELACIAFVDPLDIFDTDGKVKTLVEMPEIARRAIQAMDFDDTGAIKKIKLESKTRALELLGKTLKMFIDKVEHEGNMQFSLASLLDADLKRKTKGNKVNDDPMFG